MTGRPVLLGLEVLPAEGAAGGTYERGADEYPHVGEGLAAGEYSRADGTGRVDGGTGEVDAHQVDQDEGEADGETGQVAGTDLGISGSQDDQHEEEGSDDFHEESATYAAGIGDSVGAEGTGEIRSSHDIGKQEQAGTGDDTADELSHPVAAGVFPTHAAA